MAISTGRAPAGDPFAQFLVPPSHVTGMTFLGDPTPVGGGVISDGGGGPLIPPSQVPSGPLAVTPPAQTPWGGNGSPPASVAPGGADYQPFFNEATGRVGDSPFRRIRRGAFSPLAAPQSPARGAHAFPDGMRAL